MPTNRFKEVRNDKYRLVRIARPIMNDKTNVVDVYYEILIIDEETNETRKISEIHIDIRA